MTTDKEALFTKFLDYLQSEQTPPEYLGELPTSANSFDPYQMVGEWIALRYEVKQQGKLLRSAQDALQQALAGTRSDQEKLQTRLEESHKHALSQFEQQQEKLLRDLLGILDALDQACTYWQEELAALSTTSVSKSTQPKNFWQKLRSWFNGEDNQSQSKTDETSLNEILTSNQQGVELIRRSLLEILRQRRVVPIPSQGKPFNPQTMYAVGRQESSDFAENIVIKEVIRGYLWGDASGNDGVVRILREAQVIVAARVTGEQESHNS